MILHMRTERTGLRRAALVAAALAAVLAGWWLWDDTASLEGSSEAAAQAPVPSDKRAQVAAPALDPVPVPVPPPAVAVPSATGLPLGPAVTAMPVAAQEPPLAVPIPAPAEPQLPSLSKRDESEPEG